VARVVVITQYDLKACYPSSFTCFVCGLCLVELELLKDFVFCLDNTHITFMVSVSRIVKPVQKSTFLKNRHARYIYFYSSYLKKKIFVLLVYDMHIQTDMHWFVV